MRKGSWNVEIEFKFNIVQYNEFKKIIESILSVIFLLKILFEWAKLSSIRQEFLNMFKK